MCFEIRRSHFFEWVFVDEVFEFLRIVLFSFIQKVVHVEDQREGNPAVKLLTLPSLVIKGESLELECKNFGKPVQTVAFGSCHLVSTP